MLEQERDSALAQSTWLDRQRYRPAQWGDRSKWSVHHVAEGETWFGFAHALPIRHLSDEIAFVPLIGHTLGHAGVAVRRDDGKWLLNAGDAYFWHEEMNLENPRCTPGLQSYQLLMDKDHRARVWNQERLRHLRAHHSTEVEIFCAHDNLEFERLTASAAVNGQRVAHDHSHVHKPIEGESR